MDVLMALPEDMRGEVVLQQIQGMDFSALRAQVRGRARQAYRPPKHACLCLCVLVCACLCDTVYPRHAVSQSVIRYRSGSAGAAPRFD